MEKAKKIIEQLTEGSYAVAVDELDDLLFSLKDMALKNPALVPVIKQAHLCQDLASQDDSSTDTEMAKLQAMLKKAGL